MRLSALTKTEGSVIMCVPRSLAVELQQWNSAEGVALFSGLETHRGEQTNTSFNWVSLYQSAQTVWTPTRGHLQGQTLHHQRCPTFVP